ncbi:hypothetical protein F5Y07DRAFT_378183 [Xylaria sp. FL0933]|nr:hypothetical protein F5Y07DRAFT_378183 [Xylaria sp. FL0933]
MGLSLRKFCSWYFPCKPKYFDESPIISRLLPIRLVLTTQLHLILVKLPLVTGIVQSTEPTTNIIPASHYTKGKNNYLHLYHIMSEALAAAQRGLEILLGLGTTLVVVTGILVTIRVIWDLKSTRKLNVDDYLSVAAVIFLGATLGIFYEFLKAYINGAASFFYTSQLIVGQAIISGFATWFAKAPILTLYLRLFGIRAWVQFVCWVVLAATAIAYLVAISYNAAGCFPKSQAVGLQFVIDCTHLSSVVGTSLGGIAVATDVTIFLIPIPIIFGLNLNLQKRIGLALVFFTGALGIVASAVALSFKVKSLSGESDDVSTAVILTIVELSIAISVGCAPAARSFWINFVEETAIYSTVTSWTSQASLRFGTRTRAQKSAEAASDPSTTKNRPYDTLKDNASSVSAGRQSIFEVPLIDLERRVEVIA